VLTTSPNCATNRTTQCSKFMCSNKIRATWL